MDFSLTHTCTKEVHATKPSKSTNTLRAMHHVMSRNKKYMFQATTKKGIKAQTKENVKFRQPDRLNNEDEWVLSNQLAGLTCQRLCTARFSLDCRLSLTSKYKIIVLKFRGAHMWHPCVERCGLRCRGLTGNHVSSSHPLTTSFLKWSEERLIITLTLPEWARKWGSTDGGVVMWERGRTAQMMCSTVCSWSGQGVKIIQFYCNLGISFQSSGCHFCLSLDSSKS